MDSLTSVVNGWKSFSDTVCNRLTDKALAFLEKHIGADLLIVTGPTGTGKSSWIQSVTGQEVYVSSQLGSGTRNVALVPVVIEGKRYLLFDMPGFDAADLDDFHIFTLLMTAMATIQRYVNFRGVVYVDTFDDVRVTMSREKILTWMRLFCGDDFMPNVTIVTTKWDTHNLEGLEDKLECFSKWKETNLLNPFLTHGAHIFHHGLTEESGHLRGLSVRTELLARSSYAKGIVHQIYGMPSDLTLQIYHEIERGISLEATSAGVYLRRRLTTCSDENPIEVPDGNPFHFSGNDSQPRATSSNESRSTRNSRSGSSSRPSRSWFDIVNDARPWIGLLVNAARWYWRASSAPDEGMENFPPEDLWESDSDLYGDQTDSSRQGSSGTYGFSSQPSGTSFSCVAM